MSKRSGPSPYAEGREPKRGGGYYEEPVKLTRDSRIDESGNYKERPRSLAGDANRVSGMGLSRPVRQAGTKRYGP